MADPYVATEAGPVEPRLMDVTAAAAALSLSTRTLRRLVAEGQITSVKVGGRRLIPTRALDEFVSHLEGAA